MAYKIMRHIYKKSSRFTGKMGSVPIFAIFIFACAVLIMGPAVGQADAVCTRVNPTVSIFPSVQNVLAGSAVTYTVSVINNDSGGTCGSTTFTLSKTDAPVTPNANFTAALSPLSITLNVGASGKVTLTHTAAAGASIGATQQSYVTSAADANHAAVNSSTVTTTVVATAGDGYLLKRGKEETCDGCHRTNKNMPSPGEAGYVQSNWDNALKMHSAETLGTCANATYKTRSACVDPTKGNSTWTPGKWNVAPYVGTGWGTAGGKYGEFVCTTCHTGHSTTNIYLIKETITTPDGSNFVGSGTSSVTVEFRVKGSGIGNMGDDTSAHGTSSKICEVCHTYDAGQTTGVNKHAFNSPAGTHYNSQDCTSCHDHKKSFSGGGCTGCHGNPPVAASIGGPSGLASPATGATSPLSPGAHNAHVTTRGMTCNVCHTGNTMPTVSNTIQIGFVTNSTTYPGWSSLTSATTGAFNGYNNLNNVPPQYTFVSSNPPWTTVTTSASYANTCSTLYCHGGGTTGTTALTGGSNQSPSWVGGSSQAACGTCHGGTGYADSTTTPPTTGKHTKHASSTSGNLGLACNKCHNSTSNMGHVNGVVSWSLDTSDNRIGASAIYNGAASGSTTALAPSATYASCENLYCHSTGTSNNSPYPAPNITPTWGGSLDATCTGCHNGYSGATSKMSTGTHTAHINNASIIGSNYSCQICHSATASGNTAIWQYSSHTNKYVNVDFTALNPAGLYNGTTTPGDAYDTCSTIYCHSNGKVDGTVGAYIAPTWGGAAIGCDGCHGVGTTAGTPNYANSGAGSAGANSHTKHTGAGTSTCVYCHTNTTTTGTTITGTEHINNARNVQAGDGKNFSYAGQTCSTISCHYDGTATWGATLACNACHGLPPATGAHLTHTDGTGAAYGNDSNSSIAAAYRFNCGNCHPLNSASHANGTINIELYNASAAGFKANNPSGASVKSGSGLTTICQSVYCHSNGASGGDRAYADTPQWGNSFGANKCGQCHQNPPQYAGQSHYVASNFMGKEGGHLVGIHFDNISNRVAGSGLLTAGAGNNNSHGSSTYSTTISCYICHNGEVSATTIDTYALNNLGSSSMKCSTASCHTGVSAIPSQNGVISDKSLHINAAKNVTLAGGAFTVKSKAQLREASRPATWTRNGAYGAPGSYDSALLNGTWNSGTKTCTTACHDAGSVSVTATWGDTTVTCYSCHTSL
ncbi:MAG: CxxxxCH/CxxCH domain-containing protein [Thermodesulfovibrionales bacterium]